MSRDPSKKIPLICSGHSRPVPDLSYSPETNDGFFLISACLDGKPMLRNGMTGDWIGTFLGHKGAVWSAHLDSKALKAVTGSADYTAKIWSAITGDEIQTLIHEKIVRSVHFSTDDTKVITGSQDKLLRIFDLQKPEEPIKMEDDNQIRICQWKGENIVITASQENLKMWDTRVLKVVKTQKAAGNITSLDQSQDGTHITTAAGKVIAFYDGDLNLIKSFSLPTDMNSACLSPNKSTFVVGGSDFFVRVYDYENGKELEQHKGHHGPVHCVRFSPDGETFASGSEDGTIRILQSEPKVYGLWEESTS